MDSMMTSKEGYLARCQNVAQDYFANNQLLVSYIRKRQPRFFTEVSPEIMTDLKKLIGQISNLKESVLETIMEEEMNEQKRLEFRTVRSILRSNQSPLVGVIVAFKQGEEMKLGWSLCNLSKKDKFNQYDGIRRAIERAVPLPVIELEAALQEREELICKDGDKPIPHTCLPHIQRMIRRVKKMTRKAD